MAIRTDPLSILPKGAYEIQVPLGRGAAGEIYRARHLPSDKQVILKVLHLLDEEAFARIDRELRVLRHLSQSHYVVELLDSHFSADGQTAILAYEWVYGPTLRELVEKVGTALPDAVILAISRQLGHGVGTLHDQGVLHRDIKPSNIILASSGYVMLADLGSAVLELVPAPQDLITPTSAFVGTLRYAAPEIIQGEKACKESDLYSLGMTIAFMLLGHPPLPDVPLQKLVELVTDADLSRRIFATMPPNWQHVLRYLLGAKPKSRLRSAHAFLRFLSDVFPESDQTDTQTIEAFLREKGAVRALVFDAPRPMVRAIYPESVDSLPDLIKSLASQIATVESVLVDLTAKFSRENLALGTAEKAEQLQDKIEVRIDKTFESIRSRLRLTWRLGLLMTLVLFGTFVGMLFLSITFGLIYQKSMWGIIFGSSGIVSLLTVLLWRPMDKMLLTTVATQQLELIQIGYQHALRGTREERREAFRDVSRQLEALMTAVTATPKT